MPAVSKKQRRMAAIAEHNPEKLYARNKVVLNMAKGELHKFAATNEKNLQAVAGAKKRLRRKAFNK